MWTGRSGGESAYARCTRTTLPTPPDGSLNRVDLSSSCSVRVVAGTRSRRRSERHTLDRRANRNPHRRKRINRSTVVGYRLETIPITARPSVVVSPPSFECPRPVVVSRRIQSAAANRRRCRDDASAAARRSRRRLRRKRPPPAGNSRPLYNRLRSTYHRR